MNNKDRLYLVSVSLKAEHLEKSIHDIHDRLVRFVQNFPEFRKSPAFQCLLIDLNCLIFKSLVFVGDLDDGK